MKLLLNDSSERPAGFMIPIPQYPLYSATISEYSAEKVNLFERKLNQIGLALTYYLKKIKIGYYLDEGNNWSLNIPELERAYQESLSRCEPRGLCLINPGNPTGQVLGLENLKDILKWAYEKNLYVLADEVL